MKSVKAVETVAASETRDESISDRIARHVVGLSYDDLQPAAIAAAKQLILDTLAVAWAGSDAPKSREVLELFVKQGGAAESTVWTAGVKLPATSSAFLNSLFGASLDYDGINTVHADVVALPVALAVGQRERCSGKDFITAFVIGSDLACRLGGVMTGRHKGWFNTSIYGVFAAAAVTAKLLGLDALATRHALGIALSQAAGTQQANVEQALTKRMQSAFAAQAGIFAGLLAQKGITAPRETFEGKFGLYQLYQEGDPAKAIEGLGTRFLHEDTMLKKYPACACSHAAIEGMRELIEEYDLRPEDVSAIDATISPQMHRLVGAPFEPAENPQVTAQFSLQYGLASMLLRRRLGIEEIQDAAVLDPKVREVTSRIRIHIDEGNKGSRVPAEVKVTSKKHGVLGRRIDKFPWSWQAPYSPGEFEEKLDNCLSRGARPMDRRAQAALVELVRQIETVGDVNQLADAL